MSLDQTHFAVLVQSRGLEVLRLFPGGLREHTHRCWFTAARAVFTTVIYRRSYPDFKPPKPLLIAPLNLLFAFRRVS